MYLILAILAAYTQLSVALQGSNYDFSPAFAAQYACNESCYERLHTANLKDAAWLAKNFDFDFYATAANFSDSVPGDLLKLTTIDVNTLDRMDPRGVSYYRFQYTSVDMDNKKVPVTGFIAIPDGLYPGYRQYRAVSFAHGTLGVFRGCAPSTAIDLYDGETWSLLVKEGYAIIATDYSGLGNNDTEHKYLALVEHANDVFYALIAARQAFGDILSQEWISWGYSQGGGAVWSLAESDLLRSTDAVKAGTYLGAVSLAPVTKLYDMTTFFTGMVSTSKWDEWMFREWELLPWLGIAVKRLIPSSTMDIYADKMKKRNQLIEAIQACYQPVVAVTLDMTLDETVVTLDFSQEMDLQLHQNMSAPGRGGRADKPILVIQGTADQTIPFQITASAFEDSCATGNNVHLRTHESIGHNSVHTDLVPLYLNWMDSLFSRAVEWKRGKCTKKHYTAGDIVNMDVAKEVSELNFESSAIETQYSGLLAQPALEL